MSKAAVGELILELREGAASYGLPAEQIAEILPLPALTRLPRQSPYLLGITAYKGSIIPVLSLGALSGADNAQDAIGVICRCQESLVCFAADSAEQILTDSGDYVAYDASIMEQGRLKLSRVMRGDPAIFVLDPDATLDALLMSD
ncbi:MAG: chemotaxis protein CheW [Oscillospiraceae bacterium]|nr:chemotaxis protein CheW [Oscillospiraceae bacterium]